MQVKLKGSYKNYTLIHNNSGIIRLMKNDTKAVWNWLRITKRSYVDSDIYYLDYALGKYKNNKRMKSFINKCFEEFKCLRRDTKFNDVDEFTEEFLLYTSKSLRELKIQELLS